MGTIMKNGVEYAGSPVSIPVATETAVGGIKSGGDIKISSEGIVTLNPKPSSEFIRSLIKQGYQELGVTVVTPTNGVLLYGYTLPGNFSQFAPAAYDTWVYYYDQLITHFESTVQDNSNYFNYFVEGSLSKDLVQCTPSQASAWNCFMYVRQEVQLTEVPSAVEGKTITVLGGDMDSLKAYAWRAAYRIISKRVN